MFSQFDLFGRTIGTYAVMAVLGALAAGFFAMRHTKQRGYDDNDMLVLLLTACAGVLLGGSALYALVNLRSVVQAVREQGGLHSFALLRRSLFSLFGGSVFYGGLLGGLAAGRLHIARRRLPLGDYTDLAAPAIPLFHTFGRIGCFFGGCCYGIESKYGLMFRHSPIESANHVPRIPVQLLEAGVNLLLFLALWRLLKNGLCRHRLLAIYLVLYAGARFFLEFLRGDAYRGFLLGLSTSQVISIAIFFTTLSWLCIARGSRLRETVVKSL